MAAFLKKFFRRGAIEAETAEPAVLDGGTAEFTVGEETAMAQALRAFTQYNAKKITFLYDLMPPRKKVVYDLIPLMIHLDSGEFLENRDACLMSPHGLYGYGPTHQTQQSLAEAFPGARFPQMHLRASYDPSLPIKCLALIGSLGSIAQNAKSDFDYWICFDERVFSRESFIYFQEKLKAIEQWAEAYSGAEVHFFPLKLDQVRMDDFGPTQGESSGTALGKLLKEEFYRTLTLVAGQTPLWWIMPPGVSDEEYARLKQVVEDSGRFDPNSLVDMGNVHAISMGEFYGAAIWQINKTMGSPFKSIIKMAMLEEYMYHHGRKGLLCAELKQRLLSSDDDMDYLDPYVLMFERAAAYLQENGRLEDLDLLRRSLYMKSGAKLALPEMRRIDLPRKKKIMAELVRRWGWNFKKVDELNNFHTWSFREAQKFSHETNSFIMRTYKNVSSVINQQDAKVDLVISQRDLTVLGRKLFIYYSRRTNKIDSIRSVIETPPVLPGLTLQPFFQPNGQRIWTAYRALLSREAVTTGEGVSSLLQVAPDLCQVLIWLINNQLYDSGTFINLNPSDGRADTRCTVPDIQALLRELKAFFPPYKHGEIDEEELLKKPSTVRMLLVINLESPDHASQIEHLGLCYQNNWGEIFYKGFPQAQDGLRVAKDFVRKYFTYDPLSAMSCFKVYIPDRAFKRHLGPKLHKFFGVKAVI